MVYDKEKGVVIAQELIDDLVKTIAEQFEKESRKMANGWRYNAEWAARELREAIAAIAQLQKRIRDLESK